MDEIEIGGVVRDLRHLQPFIVTLPNKGKDGADLRVSVELGRHVISRGCDFGQQDMVDENGKPRIFCEDRYAFSLGLPELAKRMVEQNYFCWESSDRNRAINYAVIDVAPGRVQCLLDGEHQVIFFYLYPDLGIKSEVKLIIISCHSREVLFSRIKRRYNLQTLLRACLYNRKRIP